MRYLCGIYYNSQMILLSSTVTKCHMLCGPPLLTQHEIPAVQVLNVFSSTFAFVVLLFIITSRRIRTLSVASCLPCRRD